MPILATGFTSLYTDLLADLDSGSHGEFQANVYNGSFAVRVMLSRFSDCREQDYPATAYDKARGDKSDFLDNCCRNHDGCLARNAPGPISLSPPAKCSHVHTCDHQMHTCLSQVKPAEFSTGPPGAHFP